MAIKQHGLVRLQWHAVAGGEWQAGGMTRHFTIHRLGEDRFSMFVCTGDNAAIHIGIFSSLDQAKFRAQRILDEGIGK